MVTSAQSTAAELVKWVLFGQSHVNEKSLSDKCITLRLIDNGEEYHSFDGTAKLTSKHFGKLIDLPAIVI